MNKCKKLIASLLLMITVVSAFLTGIVDVKAASAPNKMTIVSIKEVQKIFGSMEGGHIASYVKKTDTGGYVYCIEANKASYEKNDTVILDKELTDPGLLYLAENAYPAKSLGFGDDVDYYITQIAIWCYCYVVNGVDSKVVGSIIDKNGNMALSFNGSSNPNLEQTKIATAAYNLYAAAKKAHDNNQAPAKPSLSVNANNTLKSNGSYLLSDAIAVKLVGASTYTVEVTNGTATIVDEAGNAKTTFNASEKFKVKVNTVDSTSVTVTVKSTGKTNKLYSYKPETNTSKQKVLYNALIPSNVDLSGKATFTYTNNNKVEFSKVDATNGKELPGATLIIKDSTGKEVHKWVSTSETHKVKLTPGNYTLTELIAPDGYLLSSETVKFTVKADGTCDKVVMKNAPIKSIEFSKVDATNGKELPGATLIIKDSTGKEIHKWVSTNETHFVKLNPGDYTLTELVAPKGYILSSETVKFTVKADGTCDKVVMKNEPKKDAVISKIDATNGKELPGAHLEIRDSKGKLVESWVSTSSVHKVKLDEGTYSLTETIAPDGYLLSSETVKFTVKADGSCDKVVMKNYPISTVEISKIDATNGEELPGATLVIKNEKGEIVDQWVSTEEIHKIKLYPGTYTLTETIAPKGYKLSTETITFIVKGDGSTVSETMENIPYTPVPVTDLNASTMAYVIGGILMLFGSCVVFKYGKKGY